MGVRPEWVKCGNCVYGEVAGSKIDCHFDPETVDKTADSFCHNFRSTFKPTQVEEEAA